MDRNEEKFSVRDLRDKNWFILDNQFLNGYAKFLGIYAVGVYNSLCRHASIKQKAYPSQKRIAEELNIGKNKVVEGIKYLEFWGIIKKRRVGLHCTNRYFLIKKSEWKPIKEETIKEFSEVYHINFRGLQNKLQKFIAETSKESKPNSKNIKKKDDFKNFKETYKESCGKRRPYFWGNPMRWKPDKQKWFVIQPDGEWLEFAGKESDIEWRS